MLAQPALQIKAAESEVPGESAYSVVATVPASRSRRALKHGDTFVVTDSFGDMGPTRDGTDGLYHADTRFLSHLELSLNGQQPLLLGSNVRDDNTLLAVDLTNPDYYVGEQIALEKDIVHIARLIFLWNGTAYQRLAIRNHSDRPLTLQIALSFDSDFADLFEVRGLQRPRRGTVSRSVEAPDRVLLSYLGLDNVTRRTQLSFDPAPNDISTGKVSYRIVLAPGESKPIFLAVTCNAECTHRPAPFLRGLLAAHRELRAQTRDIATVETSNELFNGMLCRSAADLAMLVTETPQGAYPYAGIPWYSTTFGRDGIITALQLLWCNPGLARGVLRRLAALQAKTTDAASDAEPGKILHEMRAGEMAALGEVPFRLYYGSVDSTPLFVLLAGLYFERTNDEETLRELWPAIEAALSWIDSHGDRDKDGFVEYFRQTEKGLANQGWKDSHDAIFHADGRMASGPIALAEVQGYVFAAKQLAARCAARLGHTGRAHQLEGQAERLAARFEDAFWCPQIETYALALDGEKEPCRVRTSNAGQVLFSGIARPERASLVADGLINLRFFSGWGIRTVARGEARYNPMSYHNGSIWPHDNALIALGLARYGLKRPVAQITRGLFEAASYMDLRRLPELFCGFQRERRRGPTLYPVACAPQAWASATMFSLIEALLGIEFRPQTHEIFLRNPLLPPFLDEVMLRNLQVGGSRADLRVSRHGEEVSLEVLRTHGPIQASVILSS
jgi:glycogen debranching enzyme